MKINRFIPVPGLILFFCSLAVPCIAQQRKDTLINIEEVVVTGSKTGVNRNNVPLTVSVVSNEKIESSSESALLPVLSQQVPGLFVTQRGVTGFGVSTGSAGQLSLRGIGGSPNTQVILEAMNGNRVLLGDTTVRETAGYVYFQQELFEKFVLNTGFRLENNSVYGNEPVPTAGIACKANPVTTFKASVAKGFRSPTIRELYLWGKANGDLNPERMVNYEISVLQKLLNNKLSFELTLFKSEGDNLIQPVTGTNGTKYKNSGEFSNKGIEFSGNFDVSDYLSLNANYSYISMDHAVVATPEQQYLPAAYTGGRGLI